MAETIHHFHISGIWPGDNSRGQIQYSSGGVAFGKPPQLGGEPGSVSPEEMLLGAVAACYSLTFAALAERRGLPVEGLTVEADADVVQQLGGTLKYRDIRLSPTITLSGATEQQRASCLDFAHKAEQYCVISNAIRGNVEISVEPIIIQV